MKKNNKFIKEFKPARKVFTARLETNTAGMRNTASTSNLPILVNT